MKTWQKWVVGISIILSAITGFAVACFDNDPATSASVSELVDGVQRGVQVLGSDASPGSTTSNDASSSTSVAVE